MASNDWLLSYNILFSPLELLEWDHHIPQPSAILHVYSWILNRYYEYWICSTSAVIFRCIFLLPTEKKMKRRRKMVKVPWVLWNCLCISVSFFSFFFVFVFPLNNNNILHSATYFKKVTQSSMVFGLYCKMSGRINIYLCMKKKLRHRMLVTYGD